MSITAIDRGPNKVVFFEIFSSEAAHNFRAAQDYTLQLAIDLEGKLVET